MNKEFTIILVFLLIMLITGEKAVAQNINEEPSAGLKIDRKIEPGSIVSVRNDFGDIIITGWDTDKIEASAVSAINKTPIPVSLTENVSSGKTVSFISPSSVIKPDSIILQVKIPRTIKLEPLQTEDGSLVVSNIDGLVVAKTGKGNISLIGIGMVSIQSASGNITAQNIKGSLNARVDADQLNATASKINLKNIGGSVDLTTGDGVITAQNIAGDVRLLSVSSGRINIRCVTGNVEISDTSSIINIASVRGNVEVTNSTGEAHFTGEIYGGKRYRLKTLTGVVSMAIPETSGFTALVQTYQGETRSDFTLQKDDSLLPVKNNRQLQGTYGDGKARIELDSFSGAARIRKITSAAIEKCAQ